MDNGSSDGTVEYLRSLADSPSPPTPLPGRERGERGRRVTVIANAENRGFPAAANQGIATASGRQILLLNNDTIVTPGWLTRLLQALYSHPTVGMAGPCSNFVSGAQQIPVAYHNHEEMPQFAANWAEANAGRVMETQRLVGFCLLIRRQVVERVGLLDERFGIGNFEDDDYCLRARQAGYRLVIARDAFVHHFGGRTFVGSGVDHGALMRRNQRLYREKWGARVQGSGFRVQVPEAAYSPEPRTLNPEPLLSLCMICRDNERTIRAALEGIRPWVDEMVVVDTGSKDATPQIAAGMGARVFHFPWCDDFSAARNESIRHARGRWIFWMDSDDTIDAENGRRLRELALSSHATEPNPSPPTPLPQGERGEVAIPFPGKELTPGNERGELSAPPVLGFLMKVRCPESGSNGDGDFIEVDQVKLFRNVPELRFEGRLHEQILMAIRRAGGTVAWTDLFVMHSGADQSREGRARKLERDLRILQLEERELPDHPFVLFNLGMTCAEAGEHERAISYLWQSIGRSGDDESHLRKAYALLVAGYRQLGRHLTAWETCLKGLKAFSDDPELRFRQATLLHHFGRLPEAARAFVDLLALQNGRHLSSVDHGIHGHRARQNLAGIYAELGDLARAEEQWRLVVKEVPRYRPGWRGLAEVVLRQDKFEECLALADEMRCDAALARDARLIRTAALAGCGKVAEARQELETALEQYPNDPEFLERRCRLLFEHAEADEAEPATRALIAHEPHNASAHHNLGSVLYKLRRFDESAASYHRSIELRPESAATHIHLGYALREAGNLHEAIAAWQAALRLVPDHPLAIQALQGAPQNG